MSSYTNARTELLGIARAMSEATGEANYLLEVVESNYDTLRANFLETNDEELKGGMAQLGQLTDVLKTVPTDLHTISQAFENHAHRM